MNNKQTKEYEERLNFHMRIHGLEKHEAIEAMEMENNLPKLKKNQKG